MKSFGKYQNLRIITTEGLLADGDYILPDITIRVKGGYLNDSLDEEGRVLPAVESHDSTHIEHWKNGVLHFESAPAIIDNQDNYEERWLDGVRIFPKEK